MDMLEGDVYKVDLGKSYTFKLKLQSTIYNTPPCHNSGGKEKVSGAGQREEEK